MPNRLDRFFRDDPDPPEDDMNRPRPEGEPTPSSPGSLVPPLPPAIDAEESALRRQMTDLGFVPVDPSQLEKGQPLSDEDWQALYRFHREPGSATREEKLRIIRLTGRYDTWFRAYREVLEFRARQVGNSDNQRN